MCPGGGGTNHTRGVHGSDGGPPPSGHVRAEAFVLIQTNTAEPAGTTRADNDAETDKGGSSIRNFELWKLPCPVPSSIP